MREAINIIIIIIGTRADGRRRRRRALACCVCCVLEPHSLLCTNSVRLLVYAPRLHMHAVLAGWLER